LRTLILSPNVDDMILENPEKRVGAIDSLVISGPMPMEEYDNGIDAIIDNVGIRKELKITSAHISTNKSGD
jgi:hypothetical protein